MLAPESIPADIAPNKLKISTDLLQLGMYICELDRPWLSSPFKFQGFPLSSQDEINQLQAYCSYVYIDKTKSWPDSLTKLQKTLPIPTKLEQPPRPTLGQRLATLVRSIKRRSKRPLTYAQELDQSLARTEQTFDESRKLVRNLMEDVRLGRSIDTPLAKEMVTECVDHVLHNSNAVLMLSSIKNKDAYTSEHSLNVGLLSIILGRRLGMSREQLEEVGLAGMLHDVGKVLTPDEILNKPGRLTNEEFLIMQMHPSQGYDILREQEDLSRTVLEVAHGHHERLNGSGYPRGLAEVDIDLVTRIVAVTDTFDAITSDRIYGTGRTNVEAFQILQAASGNKYDDALVSGFIDAIGIYPPGSAVQLRNGEFGIVARSNLNHKLRPIVLIMKNAQRKPIKPRYVNLAKADDTLQIAHMISSEQAGLDVHLFREEGFRKALH